MSTTVANFQQFRTSLNLTLRKCLWASLLPWYEDLLTPCTKFRPFLVRFSCSCFWLSKLPYRWTQLENLPAYLHSDPQSTILHPIRSFLQLAIGILPICKTPLLTSVSPCHQKWTCRNPWWERTAGRHLSPEPAEAVNNSLSPDPHSQPDS